MKKTLLYIAVAVILGLVLTLGPLLVLAKMDSKNHRVRSYLFTESSEKIGGSSCTDKKSLTDLWILALSFIIAFVAYAFVKSRTLLERDYRWGRHYLY